MQSLVSDVCLEPGAYMASPPQSKLRVRNMGKYVRKYVRICATVALRAPALGRGRGRTRSCARSCACATNSCDAETTCTLHTMHATRGAICFFFCRQRLKSGTWLVAFPRHSAADRPVGDTRQSTHVRTHSLAERLRAQGSEGRVVECRVNGISRFPLTSNEDESLIMSDD